MMAWPLIPPLMLLVLVLILVAVAIVLRLRRGRPSRRDRNAEKLRASYALGKIDHDEWQEGRQRVEQQPPSTASSGEGRPANSP